MVTLLKLSLKSIKFFVFIYLPIKKLKPREVKLFASSNKINNWYGRDFNITCVSKTQVLH